VVSVTDPYGRILGFLDRSRYFLSSSSSVVLTRLSGPRYRPTTFFFLVAPEIEPGPPDLYPRTLTTRPQRRSSNTQHDVIYSFLKNKHKKKRSSHSGRNARFLIPKQLHSFNLICMYVCGCAFQVKTQLHFIESQRILTN
jgi:hypothetical protein